MDMAMAIQGMTVGNRDGLCELTDAHPEGVRPGGGPATGNFGVKGMDEWAIYGGTWDATSAASCWLDVDPSSAGNMDASMSDIVACQHGRRTTLYNDI